jgi:hypothetical protein
LFGSSNKRYRPSGQSIKQQAPDIIGKVVPTMVCTGDALFYLSPENRSVVFLIGDQSDSSTLANSTFTGEQTRCTSKSGAFDKAGRYTEDCNSGWRVG